MWDVQTSSERRLKKIFTGKEAAATCPHFKGKGMCRKWHIQGHCFNTCNFWESHVPQNQLSDELKTNFKIWMDNTCKGSGSTWSVGLGLSGARLPPKPPDSLPPALSLLPAPKLQNPFTQSKTSILYIPSDEPNKKVSFSETNYNSIVDNFIAKESFGKQIKTKEPKLSTKVVDCHVDLQNRREIEDVDALRLLDGPRDSWTHLNC